MPFATFVSGSEAVHCSRFFRSDGCNGRSPGCVGLLDIKVAASRCASIPMGTCVVISLSSRVAPSRSWLATPA